MPRSKRKAAAPDFVKKKQKLGPKTRAANVTDTSLKQRQIHIRNQSRHETPLKHGLSLPDLLSRTRHHNAKTREAALNALSNALADETALAHTAKFSPTQVLVRGGDALSDPIFHVRQAGAALLLKCLKDAGDPQLVRSLIRAALSHIRADVRVDAAKLVGKMKELGLIRFVGRPLDALSDLLNVVKSPKSRAIVLLAIIAICEAEKEEKSLKRKPFFYHRPAERGREKELLVPSDKMIIRISDIAIECMPLSQSASDSITANLITNCANALSLVMHSSVSQAVLKSVSRLVKSWSDYLFHGLHEAQASLSKVAIKAAQLEIAADYVVYALSRGKYIDIDCCIRQLIGTDKQVGKEWIRVLGKSIQRRDVIFLKTCGDTLAVLQSSLPENEHVVRQVMDKIPDAVAVLLKSDDTETCCKLIEHFCECWKALYETQTQDINGLAKKMLETSFSCDNVPHKALDLIVGMGVGAGVIMDDIAIKFVLRCCQKGDYQSAERVLAGMEWISQEEGVERLRAIGVARVIVGMCKEENVMVVTARRMINW